MKHAPTLADTLYRASFNKRRNPGWTDNSRWRDALRTAKKFVLDDEMSTFLADLSCYAFTRPNMSIAAKTRTIEHLRMGARLPAETVWIEYDLRKEMARASELLGKPFDPTQTPKREGWLLQRHPLIETATIAHVITHDHDIEFGDGQDTWTFPVAFGWASDDRPLPWRPLPFNDEGNRPSEIATGLIGYKSDRAGVFFSGMLQTPDDPDGITTLLKEWVGVMRRMWALLACLNDLPVLVTEVRASRGFMGARNYRRFLDHKTITLTVPQAVYRKTARNALAMAHRRGGPVRGHFRHDWRNPLSPLCDHSFTSDEHGMECQLCKGRKIWITEHVRGDTTRGFVTTDFLIKHDTTT